MGQSRFARFARMMMLGSLAVAMDEIASCGSTGVLRIKTRRNTLSDIKFMRTRFVEFGHTFVAGSLMLGLAACGGAATDDAAGAVGEVESNLTQSQAQPFEGECTSTQTLDKVTLSTGDVIRATCSIVCSKAAYSMGVWSNYIIKPDGTASTMVSDYGTGVSGVARSTTVDVPYVPGGYQVSCKPFYQKSSSTYKTFVNWPYTPPTVF